MAQRIRSRWGNADTLAELDEDLRRLTADLRACQIRGETAMVERLYRWIDDLLDDRASLTSARPGTGRHRASAGSTTAADSQKEQARAEAE